MIGERIQSARAALRRAAENIRRLACRVPAFNPWRPPGSEAPPTRRAAGNPWLRDPALDAAARERLPYILRHRPLLSAVTQDMEGTLCDLGLQREAATALTRELFTMCLEMHGSPLAEFEQALHERIAREPATGPEGRSIRIRDRVEAALWTRAAIMARQLDHYLPRDHGRILDFGCGDGRLTQHIHDTVTREVDGVDPLVYPAPGVRAPLHRMAHAAQTPFPDGSFHTIVATHVLSHVPDLDACLRELVRLSAPGATLVMIETAPFGKRPQDQEFSRWRAFLGDTWLNRWCRPGLDLSLPVRYETSAQWCRLLERYGIVVTRERFLGVTQPLARNPQQLLVGHFPIRACRPKASKQVQPILAAAVPA